MAPPRSASAQGKIRRRIQLLSNPHAEVDASNLNVKAYQAIRRGLIIGTFRPREKLLLRPLATELGISVTPLREALLQLVSEQALSVDNAGTVYVPLLTPERYIEIRNLRAELEAKSAVAALKLITPEDISELEQLHVKIIAFREAGDFARSQLINEHFHFMLYGIARMPVLYRILESLWCQVGPLLRLRHEAPPDYPSSDHIHLDLLRGLRRSDEELVRHAIRHGIMRISDSMIALIEKSAAAPGVTR